MDCTIRLNGLLLLLFLIPMSFHGFRTLHHRLIHSPLRLDESAPRIDSFQTLRLEVI